MSSVAGRTLVVGVCGGIAAYKVAGIVSTLVQRGADVHVVMTEAAQRFVAPLTFHALSANRVHTSLWEIRDREDHVLHVTLAHRAAALLIAPATADAIAKLVHGYAEDLLGAVALAARCPMILAPAMNSSMWEHPATRANVAALRARGWQIVGPESGFLAERERGVGRLAAEERIIAALEDAVARTHELEGQHVLVTAGATREAIDPVRFISNASTGAMGIEIAREATLRGAQVDLVLGPTHLDPPHGARAHRVESAREMHERVMALREGVHVIVAAAAVADWRPAVIFVQKVKKEDVDPMLRLERNPDILAQLGAAKGAAFLVGFAAETEHVEEHAREKLARKRLDLICVNDVSQPGIGFASAENEMLLLWEHGREPLERASKREIAARIWDRIATLRGAERAHEGEA
ncbi:bifunctional phosphopantothenoylcysteine decarboxylase/phosphopantothenate--cysteine ligase CoaBC [bacterium]|nr:MAG: bifunctional phosphopantothenoylcysteine decarboxylase/phosphopantothenate--cysteine ligase CoaBC [bacterium]